MIKSDFTQPADQAGLHIGPYSFQLLDKLQVAIYTCNASGYITHYNDAAAELWGRRPEIGKERWCGSWKIFEVNGRPIDLGACPTAETLTTGTRVSSTTVVIERPDGTHKRVIPDPNLLFNEKGELTGAICLLRDVTEQSLYEAQTAYLAAIVASSDDAIISKTLNGIVTSWNSSAQRIFGYTAEEMIGEPILKLIPDDRKEEEPKILSTLAQGIRVDHFETKRITKEGRLLDISLTISPIRDSTGHIIGVSKVARDITAQKLAERQVRESDERFRMAVAATRLGTWEFAPQSGALHWSDECRGIYQIPADLPIDFDLFIRLTHPEDLEYALAAIQHAQSPESGGDYDITFRILRYNDGEVRWIRSQGKVYFNAGKAEKFIGTVLDITDEKLAKARLEHKVQERTKDLKEANQKLAISNNELEQFAFVASHDLQEPLRKIQAFGDMLKTKLSEAENTGAQDLIARMQSASARMKVLIDNLLTFSRISFNEQEHQLINLSQLVGEVANDLEGVINDKKVTVTIGKLYPVKAEPLHMRQLFQNLIGNALKFSADERAPYIAIKASLVNGAESGLENLPSDAASRIYQLITVADNGIGFEQEYAHKIFGLFQRLHGKHEYPGSGMGLSIVHKVVSQHQGFIDAVSTPGAGTTFRILLPFQD